MQNIQEYTLFIKASPEAIWEAWVSPEWSIRYGYAPVNHYELRVGGKYEATANEGMKAIPGVPDVICDGEVLEVTKPFRLVQTWRMLMEPSLAAEGFTRLSFEIKPIRSGVCKVSLIHDLTNAPELAEMVSGKHIEHGAGGGWAEILSGLKTLLETGKQLPFLSGPEGC